MSAPLWSGERSRKIVKRIVVEGDLTLQTPAHLGNGDGDELTDMPLLIDPHDDKTPLLTGASIAGALRDYMRTRERGYGQPLPDMQDIHAAVDERNSMAVKLFGGFRADDHGEQSPLIVEDALGKNYGIEMREGVKINTASRTAQEDALYDVQLWQAGTTFSLRFELLIRANDNPDDLKQALTTALTGLDDGGVTLGARKRRGYGRIKAGNWRVKIYDLTTRPGLLDWIANGSAPLSTEPVENIGAALGVKGLVEDARAIFDIHAEFVLDGSILIRSGGGESDIGPDMVHLHALQPDKSTAPILSGTSLGGALRARAFKIANTLALPHGALEKAHELIGEMFGPEIQADVKPRASRVLVQEHSIRKAKTDLVQNRVSIDRFSGGARETALFNERPAYGGQDTHGADTRVTVDVRLVAPQPHEIGLLLLLLKDLWEGDLPLGGESSVGRGRLKGQSAILTYKNSGAPQTWTISARGKELAIPAGRNDLEEFVGALGAYVKGVTA